MRPRDLYRQERILKRIGAELPRATLASWMVRLREVIQPLINLMREALLAYDIVLTRRSRKQIRKSTIDRRLPGK